MADKTNDDGTICIREQRWIDIKWHLDEAQRLIDVALVEYHDSDYLKAVQGHLDAVVKLLTPVAVFG